MHTHRRNCNVPMDALKVKLILLYDCVRHKSPAGFFCDFKQETLNCTGSIRRNQFAVYDVHRVGRRSTNESSIVNAPNPPVSRAMAVSSRVAL